MLLSLIPTALAQSPGIIVPLPECDFVTGAFHAACIPAFIAHLIEIVFSLISVFFIINVLYAGYQIAIGYSTGNSKTEGAERLRWSIMGLIVAVCSFLILDLIITVISPS